MSNSLVARIGFSLDTSYAVNEIDGTVEFRIGVIEGNLAAPVTINFATSDASAICKFHGYSGCGVVFVSMSLSHIIHVCRPH